MLRDGSFEGSSEWGTDGHDDAERSLRVHRKLKRIVKARGALDREEAAALREAQALRLWRRHGYNSLVEYMEVELGYTPRAALDRLRVAKAIEELPRIGEALSQGDLSFSAARELTRVATGETEQAWLDASAELNVRQVEELVSGHAVGDVPADPIDPGLVREVLRYEVSPEVKALARQAKKIVTKQRGERLDDDAFLAAVFRQVIDGPSAPASSIGADGAGAPASSIGSDGAGLPASSRTRAAYQVATTICRQCKRGWQDGGGAVVEMSPPAVERALCDADEIGALDDGKVHRARQAIPPATRRKVLRRDHDRCRVPGCHASTNLDLHHLVPRERGGTHDLENLIVLCEGHHLAHHEGSLVITGTASTATFERRPNHAFKRETRAVDTANALRALGWSAPEVKAALAKTRAHVGETDLTLEQWIKIALGYCPSSA